MYHRKLVAGILAALVVFTFAFSLSAGQYDLSFVQVAAWFCHQLGLPVLEDVQVSAQQEAVLMFIRSPRTLVGFMVGAGLAASGTILQGLFSNPLADPGIIGVSSGATVGAVLAITLGVNAVNMFAMPAFAFVGAIAAVLITIGLASRNGRIPVLTLLLSGVVVGMLLGAITAAMLVGEACLVKGVIYFVGKFCVVLVNVVWLLVWMHCHPILGENYLFHFFRF